MNSIKNMFNGDIGYVVPWAFDVRDGQLYVNPFYPVLESRGGTANIEIKKLQDQLYVCDDIELSQGDDFNTFCTAKVIHYKGKIIWTTLKPTANAITVTLHISHEDLQKIAAMGVEEKGIRLTATIVLSV